MAFNSAIELPPPLASGTRVISNALRVVDARPIIRSSCAQRITWSQPPSGNSSRPSTLKANGTLNARATTFPSATPANAYGFLAGFSERFTRSLLHVAEGHFGGATGPTPQPPR